LRKDVYCIVTRHQNPDYLAQIGRKKEVIIMSFGGDIKPLVPGDLAGVYFDKNQNLLVVGQDSRDGEGVGRTVIAA